MEDVSPLLPTAQKLGQNITDAKAAILHWWSHLEPDDTELPY